MLLAGLGNGSEAATVDDITDSALIHVGFADLRNARRWLQFPELEPVDLSTLLRLLEAHAASADTALRSLVRLIEFCPSAVSVLTGTPEQAVPLIRILGASEALGEFLIRHPDQLDVVTQHPDEEPVELSGDYFRRRLMEAVGAHANERLPQATCTADTAYQALRVAYRRELIRIALQDLSAQDPVGHVPVAGRQLADLAAAAVDAALAISRVELSQSAEDTTLLPRVGLAVIGMGKCGARELNYVSDVDVIYVHDLIDTTPQTSMAEKDDAAGLATKLVTGTMRAIMAPSAEPPLWELDANLRPEGKDGPLSRTVESHVRYYRKWAKSWEFQALLKARPIAGDWDLAQRYMNAITPFVWESSQREGFVESVRTMRRRVADNIPAEQRSRQIKLGPGGLRDVEFTVQLLQLVHGNKDCRVRTQATTESLEALAEYGYIARQDAEQFGAHYRWLRLLEHRIQLFRLRRTHVMPTQRNELSVIAAAMQPPGAPQRMSGDVVETQWRQVQRAVRGIHEKIFYRPLLAALSHTPLDGAALNDEQVRDRLGILGYRDPRAAQRHLEELTKGVSRRAQILRTLLPVLLEWIAHGVDADAGLLGFRRVSESLGASPWYLRMLRDSTTAAERLCRILSSSRYITDALENQPEAVAWLGSDHDLVPRDFEQLRDEIRAQMERHDDANSAIRMIRVLRRREVLRVALSDVCGLLDVDAVCKALSDIDRATVVGALDVAERDLHSSQGAPLRAVDVVVVAMGRQGGREIGYGSDADLMYVYQSRSDDLTAQAGDDALHVVHRMLHLLTTPCTPPIVAERRLEIDNDLRPEGKQGPMIRSVDSYREYYDRWAQTWEFQALTRALPIAGPEETTRRFTEVIDAHRYPARFTPQQLDDIRRMKARVENERLPSGADPTRHLKLGRGSLSDVEWLAQTLQLQYGHDHPALRTTNTVHTLQAAANYGLLEQADTDVLVQSWRLCTQIRNGNVLRTGRSSDVLPKTGLDMEAVARWCGYSPGQASAFEDDYLRITRQARAVFERLFYTP